MSNAAIQSTWEPADGTQGHGRLDAAQVNALPDTAFAFPHARKEPITDAAHVRNALARFDQVMNVTDAERDLAFANIRKAARHYGIAINETDWRQLGVGR
jgi:hypothetical protein